jgi:hypothetical protein
MTHYKYQYVAFFLLFIQLHDFFLSFNWIMQLVLLCCVHIVSRKCLEIRLGKGVYSRGAAKLWMWMVQGVDYSNTINEISQCSQHPNLHPPFPSLHRKCEVCERKKRPNGIKLRQNVTFTLECWFVDNGEHFSLSFLSISSRHGDIWDWARRKSET